MKKKPLALTFLLLWPVLAAWISFAMSANILVSMMLFFGVPAFVLSVIKPALIKKSFLFSIIVSVPIATVVDYIMEYTRGWFLPHSVFGSFRLLGYVTLEQHIWLFLYVYFILMFYEVFFERHPRFQRLYRPKLKYLAMVMFAALGAFLVILGARGTLLNISYFYLKFGLVVAIAPIMFALFKMPRLMGKALQLTSYFFFLSFIYEITALKLGQWVFPAENQFLGIIQAVGVRFPVEELLFWMMLGPLATISYYEFFDDDRK